MNPESIPDPFDCYELCVQSPRHIVAFLHAVHGNQPITLGEDFCGRAAVARYWCRFAARNGDAGRAICVDLDPAAIEGARAAAADAGILDRLELACRDATLATPNPGAADIIFVGNFSIGYIHTSARLVDYLRTCKRRLDLAHSGFGGGLFVCDTYGGAGAFKLGGLTRTHPSRAREIIRYHWVHESADPLTGTVENSISFQVVLDGEIIREYPRAFTYRWRLWSIHELREAMLEAGFAETGVYKDVDLAPGESPMPITDRSELGDDWIVLISARA